MEVDAKDNNFDPVVFVQKPQNILRLLALLFSIIVFGSLSSQGWRFSPAAGAEVCIINQTNSICQYATVVAVIAFIAALSFIAGECYYLQNSYYLTSRKTFVLADIIFSGFWAFLFLVSFCAMAHGWSASQAPAAGYGSSNVGAAISFSFFSIFTWGVSAMIALQIHQKGFEENFGDISLETGGSEGTEFGGGFQAGSLDHHQCYQANSSEGERLQQVRY